MRDSITKLLARYGLPLLGAAFVAFLRAAVHPSYLDQAPFVLPFLVVLAAAWFGGIGPGLFSIGLGILFASVWPVLGWIDIEPIGFEAALARFGIGSTVLCFLIARLQRGERRFKTEEERRHSQIAELAAIVENTDDAVIGTTLDGIVTSWNAGAERLYGYSAEEAIGGPINLVVPLDRPDEVPQILARLRRGERISHFQTVRVRKDGSRVEVSATISPLLGPTGEIVGTASITRNETERRRTETTLRFLAEASESLSALVDYRATLQKVAQLAVPGFADWCAVDMLAGDGAIERLAVAHVDPSMVKFAQEIQERYPADPNDRFGVPNVLRTGRSVLVSEIPESAFDRAIPDANARNLARELGLRSFLCVPLRLKDHTLGAMSFVATESGRRYDAADLKAAEDLARRAAIAIENARLYQELRDSDRRKDEFLAVLSHELRNPLAPIRSGLDMLAMDGPHENQGLVELMRQQVEHLVRLVDDLLDLSRITRGRVELKRERVDLGSLLERSAGAMRSTIEQRDQTLTIVPLEKPLAIEADPVRLLQVIENLLQNASKFSDAGSPIELAAQAEGSEVAIRVRDHGIGIEPGLLPHLFQPFTQAQHSIDRAQGGLGVGLALVRGLVERHGGTVTAASAGPGRGSEFEVRLPIERGAVVARAGMVAASASDDSGEVAVRASDGSVELEVLAHEDPEDGAARGRRVLVVDDNVAAAQMLSLLVSRLGGHQVDTVHDGPSAIERVRSSHPEIVLLDIGLPAMDGYEVGRTIRADPRFDDVLIVALTGYGQDEDRTRSRDAGFDEHLVKPAAIDDLERLLEHPKLRTLES